MIIYIYLQRYRPKICYKFIIIYSIRFSRVSLEMIPGALYNFRTLIVVFYLLYIYSLFPESNFIY